MRAFDPRHRTPAVFTACAVAAVGLLGTFTHIVSQATQNGAARYTTAPAKAAATKAVPQRKLAAVNAKS